MKNKNPFGINKCKNDYDIYLGKEVRVSISGIGFRIGKFYSHDSENIYLKPVLVDESLPIDEKTNKKKIRVETEIYTSINKSLVGIIERLEKGYLEKLVNAINNKKD